MGKLLNEEIVSVVLSGGTGSRLWPASRESFPKPFLKLNNKKSLIEQTYARANAISKNIFTITNREYLFLSRYEQNLAGVASRFLLEPCPRNTAPAIAMAAKLLSELNGPNSILVVLPSDHLIHDEAAFKDSVANGISLARDGFIVTFGIVPTRAETGYGYIRCGAECNNVAGWHVDSFHEKPSVDLAEKYLASGDYFWNSGMFCFKVGVFLEEVAKWAPTIDLIVNKFFESSAFDPMAEVFDIPLDVFEKFQDISVDSAVMEFSNRVAMVRASFDWSDVGSWNYFKELVPADENMNRAIGDVLFHETTNTFAQSSDRFISTIGVRDLVIVDTPDALLVSHCGTVDSVKEVVKELNNKSNQITKIHRSVTRPWGRYIVLGEGDGFKIKKIEVSPHSSLSLQSHKHRSEHWVVVCGSATIINGESSKILEPNQSTYIPAGVKHRLSNVNDSICVLIEVQCGSYLGEDDIVRYEDVYGR